MLKFGPACTEVQLLSTLRLLDAQLRLDFLVEGTGQFDTGLLFISFQKDPEQFIKIQNMLGADDKLNEYIKHIGSGIFAILPGVEKGKYLGQSLFE